MYYNVGRIGTTSNQFIDLGFSGAAKGPSGRMGVVVKNNNDIMWCGVSVVGAGPDAGLTVDGPYYRGGAGFSRGMLTFKLL